MAKPFQPAPRVALTRRSERSSHGRSSSRPTSAFSVLVCDEPDGARHPDRRGREGRGRAPARRAVTRSSPRSSAHSPAWSGASPVERKSACFSPPSALRQRVKLVRWHRAPTSPRPSRASSRPSTSRPSRRAAPHTTRKPSPPKAPSAPADTPTSSTPSPPPDDNPGSPSSASAASTSSRTATPPICSVSGDVWVVCGIDDKLEQLKWRRFATGLFQPLGLKIVDDKVYVLGRDQITRLHDLNGDGEADFYENFNNDCKVTAERPRLRHLPRDRPRRELLLHRSAATAPSTAGRSCASARTARSSTSSPPACATPTAWASSPDGVITVADNQGEWVPASRIDVVKPGSSSAISRWPRTQGAADRPGQAARLDAAERRQLQRRAGLGRPTTRWGPLAGRHAPHVATAPRRCCSC